MQIHHLPSDSTAPLQQETTPVCQISTQLSVRAGSAPQQMPADSRAPLQQETTPACQISTQLSVRAGSAPQQMPAGVQAAIPALRGGLPQAGRESPLQHLQLCNSLMCCMHPGGACQLSRSWSLNRRSLCQTPVRPLACLDTAPIQAVSRAPSRSMAPAQQHQGQLAGWMHRLESPAARKQ